MTSPEDKHTTQKTDSGSLVSIRFCSHALPIKKIEYSSVIFTEKSEQGESFL